MNTRPWGSYELLRFLPEGSLKLLHILPRSRLSLQRHEHRDEHWIVLRGSVTAEVNETVRKVLPGEYIYVPSMATHRLSNESSMDIALVAEVQVGMYCTAEEAELDITRLEDDYQRCSEMSPDSNKTTCVLAGNEENIKL